MKWGCHYGEVAKGVLYPWLVKVVTNFLPVGHAGVSRLLGTQIPIEKLPTQVCT